MNTTFDSSKSIASSTTAAPTTAHVLGSTTPSDSINCQGTHSADFRGFTATSDSVRRETTIFFKSLEISTFTAPTTADRCGRTATSYRTMRAAIEPTAFAVIEVPTSAVVSGSTAASDRSTSETSDASTFAPNVRSPGMQL
eukprot:3937855-Rhodomonas_salina.2